MKADPRWPGGFSLARCVFKGDPERSSADPRPIKTGETICARDPLKSTENAAVYFPGGWSERLGRVAGVHCETLPALSRRCHHLQDRRFRSSTVNLYAAVSSMRYPVNGSGKEFRCRKLLSWHTNLFIVRNLSVYIGELSLEESQFILMSSRKLMVAALSTFLEVTFHWRSGVILSSQTRTLDFSLMLSKFAILNRRINIFTRD